MLICDAFELIEQVLDKHVADFRKILVQGGCKARIKWQQLLHVTRYGIEDVSEISACLLEVHTLKSLDAFFASLVNLNLRLAFVEQSCQFV